MITTGDVEMEVGGDWRGCYPGACERGSHKSHPSLLNACRKSPVISTQNGVAICMPGDLTGEWGPWDVHYGYMTNIVVKHLLSARAPSDSTQLWSPNLRILGEDGTWTIGELCSEMAQQDANCAAVVLRLIEMTADPNELDEHGCSPLHHACSHGYVNVVELLLAAKANPNQENEMGFVPLHHAVLCHTIHESASLAITTEAEAQCTVTVGGTLFNMSSSETKGKAHDDNLDVDVRMGQLLLNQRADPNGQGPASAHKLTPLHVACRSNNMGAAQLLIEYRVDTARKDENGETALSYPAVQNDLMKMLFAASQGETAPPLGLDYDHDYPHWIRNWNLCCRQPPEVREMLSECELHLDNANSEMAWKSVMRVFPEGSEPTPESPFGIEKAITVNRQNLLHLFARSKSDEVEPILGLIGRKLYPGMLDMYGFSPLHAAAKAP